MSNKYYAVKVGKAAGIYTNYSDCLKQVRGVSGAVYKSFKNRKDAEDFINHQQVTFKNVDEFNQADFDVLVHTDGGCRNHGNVKGGHVLESDPAAWACLIQDLKLNKNYSSTNGECEMTNNYMEIRAVMRSLQFMVKLGLNNKKILFVCDSKYALRASDKDWLQEKADKGFNITNGDIWRHIYDLLNKYYNNNITWAWTHDHEGEKGNEFVDHLLNRTMDKLEKQKHDN